MWVKNDKNTTSRSIVFMNVIKLICFLYKTIMNGTIEQSTKQIENEVCCSSNLSIKGFIKPLIIK